MTALRCRERSYISSLITLEEYRGWGLGAMLLCDFSRAEVLAVMLADCVREVPRGRALVDWLEHQEASVARGTWRGGGLRLPGC